MQWVCAWWPLCYKGNFLGQSLQALMENIKGPGHHIPHKISWMSDQNREAWIVQLLQESFFHKVHIVTEMARSVPKTTYIRVCLGQCGDEGSYLGMEKDGQLILAPGGTDVCDQLKCKSKHYCLFMRSAQLKKFFWGGLQTSFRCSTVLKDMLNSLAAHTKIVCLLLIWTIWW